MIKLTRPDNAPHLLSLTNKTSYKHKYNKGALKKANFDKCMYCESKVTDIDFGQVEHFKPKAKDKYPELEFEWANLGFVCPVCNNTKNDKFDNNTPYIDPYSDNPEEHFTFLGTIIRPKLGCERADLSIIDIDLNRLELIESRKTRLELIENSITACFRTRNPTLKTKALDALKLEQSPNSEYSLMLKHLFNAHGI